MEKEDLVIKQRDCKMKAIIIFDIGKTNKKAIIYDYDLHELWSLSVHLPEILDEDDDACDDINAITSWIEKTLTTILNEGHFQITHINFSSYGASFIHINEDGKLLTPLYNYIKPFPKELRDSFYAQYGNEKIFAKETASPPLDFLNSGLQIFYIKKKYPHIFNQIKWSLHLPQYLCYYFTREPFSEFTSIGCHTALWDFSKNDYHQWVYQEQINHKFPEIKSAHFSIPYTYKDQTIKMGIGIHDSSSALYTFNNRSYDNYLVISTGTWSITFNPFSSGHLSEKDLENDCLLFLQPNGNPVKASRLFLGNAYQNKNEDLKTFFKEDIEELKSEKIDIRLFETICQESKKYFSFPNLIFSENIDATTDYSVFKSYKIAYYQMVWELAQYQIKAIHLAAENQPIKVIFIEGGFTQNELFLAFLKYQLPGTNIEKSTDLTGAALGAAMLIFQ